MPLLSADSAVVMVIHQLGRRVEEGDDHIFPRITPREQHILMIVALVSALISVASSTLAFYWFVKMRRNFRHDLIMLLIQSDMFKALWFMVYPLVVFLNGPIRDDSSFCQISGFFLTVGIEQADVAALIIAVHSALFIFHHKPFSKEKGLYPYRHSAYAFWCIFPIIVASLAFIGGRNAYVAEGTYCYLQVRPVWYRLALDWIPRYIIFLVILSLYGSIYYYARRKFHNFRKDEIDIPRPTRWAMFPKYFFRSTHLFNRGQTPELSPTSIWNEEANFVAKLEGSRRSFADVGRFTALASYPPVNGTSIVSSTNTMIDEESFPALAPSQPLPLFFSPSMNYESTYIDFQTVTKSRATSWTDSSLIRFASQKLSNNDIFNFTRRPSNIENINVSPLKLQPLYDSPRQMSAKVEIIATRDKIRRQLRFLFIYPLVYVGMWIVPFVTHILQYEDRYALNPPFALTCVTTVCTCIQAAVDCWLFSTREKPWRHIPGSDGSFCGSLKFWTGWDCARNIIPQTGPGKTRDEMVREARVAYQRRDDEMAQRRNQIESPRVNSEPYQKSPRSWWDLDKNGDFGTLSSAEENSMLIGQANSENGVGPS
ncbi:hypothetical protein K3495_g8398 [Podosphaera aphanis]|nr:hypothetical protein K3495_g8398 [Podosphaera aphanis]